MTRAAVLAIAIVAAAARVAAAHQTAVKYADVHVDGADLAIEFRTQPSDFTRPLGLPDDAYPTIDQALAGADKVSAFAARWLVIRNDGQPCTATAPAVGKATIDPRFLAFHWTAHCPTKVDALTLDFDGFFAIDKVHVVLLHLTSPETGAYNTTVDVGDSPLTMRLTEPPSTVLAWIWLGMLHIYSGRDHISFVLALLLVVVIGRRGGGTAGTATPTTSPGTIRSTGLTTAITACTAAAIWIGLVRGDALVTRDVLAFAAIVVLAIGISERRIARPMVAWERRPVWPTLRATATVITAFTIAHSLTLIAASLGWLHLPSRFVETMIAVSIAYTAIEDVIKPDVRWRYVLTFGFGLIHGLGFASVLSELLPPGQVVAPLLEFNVGVELGQLSIVAVALPLFALVARLVGADRYRARVLPALASVIAALAAIWIVERIAGVVILGL